MADPFQDDILLKIANILSYLFFFGSNVWHVAWPGGIYRWGPNTYFSLGYHAYGIWSIIHLLLIGYLIYQFFDTAKPLIIDTIGWRFPILAVITSIYVNVHNHGDWLVAFVFAALMCAAVTHILLLINAHNSNPKDLNDILWVYLPLALYHAWTVVLVILGAFEAFGYPYRLNIATKVLVFLGLSALLSMCIFYTVWFHNPIIEIPAACAIAWSIFAIFEHQSNDFIHFSALAFFILACLWIAERLFGWYSKRHGGTGGILPERAPLLGSA